MPANERKKGVESNEKALAFQSFLVENDIDAFSTESIDDDALTVVFRSRIEASGQILPLAIFIDTSLFVLIRTEIVRSVPADRQQRFFSYLGALNRRFKLFKYYMLDDGAVYLDITLPYLDEGFDPKMVQLVLSILVQHLGKTYEEIMRELWGK